MAMPLERLRKVQTWRVNDGVSDSMSATQSWKRWKLRIKPMTFPIMGYDCGHGVLVREWDLKEKRKKIKIEVERNKVKRVREAR